MSSPVRLGNYLAEMRAYAPEIAATLTPDEQHDAWEYVQHVGRQEFYRWLFENLDDVLKYLEATPSKRKSNKTWQEAPYKYGLVVGTLLLLHPATTLIDQLDQLNLMDGGRYRSFAQKAVSLFLSALNSFYFHNPFEDLD